MDVFDFLIDWYKTHGYACLFFCVLLENTGLPIPGETAVLVAGFLASASGGSHLKLSWIIPVAFLAAVCGDNLGYFLGYRFARRFLERRQGFLFLTPQRLKKIDSYFQCYGIWSVAIARFIAGVRTICALSAGVAGMPWKRFFLVDALAALVWATYVSVLGYTFGKSWRVMHHALGWGTCAVAIAVLVAVVLYLRAARNGPTPNR
jgi:membrane protein DedA with SNARE-associated domain